MFKAKFSTQFLTGARYGEVTSVRQYTPDECGIRVDKRDNPPRRDFSSWGVFHGTACPGSAGTGHPILLQRAMWVRDHTRGGDKGRETAPDHTNQQVGLEILYYSKLYNQM